MNHVLSALDLAAIKITYFLVGADGGKEEKNMRQFKVVFFLNYKKHVVYVNANSSSEARELVIEEYGDECDIASASC